MTDTIGQRFAEIDWVYVRGETEVSAELERRIADIDHNRSLITYSKLVRGVAFGQLNLREYAAWVSRREEAIKPMGEKE